MKLEQTLKTQKALNKLFSDGGSNAKHTVMDSANVCMALSTNKDLLKPFEDGEHNKLPPADFLTGARASRYSVEYLKKIIASIEATGANSAVLVMKQDYPLLVTAEVGETINPEGSNVKEKLGFILAPVVGEGTPADAREIWNDWKALEKPEVPITTKVKGKKNKGEKL